MTTLVVGHLWLTDFRNYTGVDLELPSGLTVVVGDNGHGKTNLLEAVGYAARGRSFRGASPDALVRVGADGAVVRVAGERDGRAFLVEADVRPSGRSRLQLNGQALRRNRDLLEALSVSVFTPDDLVVVKGGPSERRELIDDVVVACRPSRDVLRSDLERILRQKAALLRQARGGAGSDVRSTLEVWNAKLVEVGEALVSARVQVLEHLEPLVVEAYRQIADHATTQVGLSYRSAWSETGLAVALDDAVVDELRRGVCLVGPQRDDIAISIDDLPSRTHASQGEQRTLALALRLGAHRLVSAESGVTPVLLLDDIFSELDPGRSTALLANLPSGQALLTTAGPVPSAAQPDLFVTIREGRVQSP